MSSPALPPAAVQSPFQLFIKGIQDLYPDKSIKSVLESYPVPQLVMIGSESTGKSSVLENITKTEIFPTNQKTCTRCPIKVVMIPAENGEINSIVVDFRGQKTSLTDQAALKRKMEELFEHIRTSSPSGYSDDAVTITLVHPNVVRIDLVDLPGIVSYPPEARDFTTKMCLRYIRDPNSFLICVANATIPRLNSYEPIARILENNAQDRTIIVLTMADKLRLEDYTAQLKNRLYMSTDELTGKRFLTCCAIVNRGSQEVPLVDQPGIEDCWFKNHLLVGLTEWDQATLTSHLGIAQLQLQVNELYERYLRENWLPRTVADIQAKVQMLQAQIAELGTVVDALNATQFRDDLLASAVLERLFQCIQAQQCIRSKGVRTNSQTKFHDQEISIKDIVDLTYAKRCTDAMKAAVHAFDVSSLVDQVQHRHIGAAFGKVFGGGRGSGGGRGIGGPLIAGTEWKPLRFTALWVRAKSILCEVIDDYISRTLLLLQPTLLQQLLAAPNDGIDYADRVIQHSSAIFIDACKERLFTKDAFVEDAAVARQRTDLHKSVAKYEAVKDALLASVREGSSSPDRRIVRGVPQK
jgi:GTP-binding protein EngB required for normal cell division